MKTAQAEFGNAIENLVKSRMAIHAYYVGTVSASEQRQLEVYLDKIDAALKELR